jgi:hypothetical protein
MNHVANSTLSLFGQLLIATGPTLLAKMIAPPVSNKSTCSLSGVVSGMTAQLQALLQCELSCNIAADMFLFDPLSP